MMTHASSKKEEQLRTHNAYDSLVTQVLMEQHPEWSVEVVREASLLSTNTLLPLFGVMYGRKELEDFAMSAITQALKELSEEVIGEDENELLSPTKEHEQRAKLRNKFRAEQRQAIANKIKQLQGGLLTHE